MSKHLSSAEVSVIRSEVGGLAGEFSLALCVSCGNDSIALLHWAIQESKERCCAIYNDTGWAAPFWHERVERVMAYAEAHGITVFHTKSDGMLALTERKGMWPSFGTQFCTQELKIIPTLRLLEKIDPECELICCNGMRRAESRRRRDIPEFVESNPRVGGRSTWSPLAAYSDARRNEAVLAAGFDVLPHRSQECYPCIYANRYDLRQLDEQRIALIEQHEGILGYPMFRPTERYQHANGIREVMRWARSERGKYGRGEDDGQLLFGCDSGFCGG